MKVGIISNEFFELSAGRMGGFGWAAKEAARWLGNEGSEIVFFSGERQLSNTSAWEVDVPLVEAGRSVLNRIARDVDPPQEEVADILRRLAISLLADIPRDAGREPRATSLTTTVPAG